MKKTHLLLFLLIVSVAFLSSCIIAVVDYSGDQAWMPGKSYHQTLSFEKGGNLSLDNDSGRIEIRGWDNDEIDINADRLLPRPYRPKFRVARMGSEIPDIVVNEYRNGVRIYTEWNENSERRGRVDYSLTVPRFVHLESITQGSGDIFISSVYGSAHVEAGTGDILIENYSGSLYARTETGKVEIHLYDLRDEDKIRIESGQGDIVVFLDKQIDAQVEAETPEGEVFSAYAENKTPVPEKFSQKLGKGGAVIFLNAEQGDIQIKVHNDETRD